MISDLKRAKFTQYFEVSDTDGDGRITKQDYLAAADKVIAVLKLDPTSPPAQTLKATYAQNWDALVAGDLARKDAVTMDQWIQHWYTLGQDPKRFEDIAVRRGDAVMHVFDTDHDQRISKSEWALFFSTIGHAEKHYDLGFQKLDRNHDGYLTLDDIRTAGREFYTSDDAAAPGNWFFGDYTKHLHA
jgi:Ca2+-binding EF-hand superfamily protein